MSKLPKHPVWHRHIAEKQRRYTEDMYNDMKAESRAIGSQLMLAIGIFVVWVCVAKYLL